MKNLEVKSETSKMVVGTYGHHAKVAPATKITTREYQKNIKNHFGTSYDCNGRLYKWSWWSVNDLPCLKQQAMRYIN